MRVLLVYSNQIRGLLPAPPIGLSYVASATHRAGHEVRLLDLRIEKMGQIYLKPIFLSTRSCENKSVPFFLLFSAIRCATN